jgi:putative endonuclease
MTLDDRRVPRPQSGDARRARYRAGLRSEWLASLALMANGCRILDRRWKSAAGEIDLVAARGRRVVFVEVKHRGGLDDAEAHAAIGPAQRARIRRAAELWMARHPRYRTHDIGFDLVLVAPLRWPRRIENGL